MPLAAFIGDDTLNRNEALDHLVSKWIEGESEPSLAREVVFGEDIEWQSLADSYGTVSLFAGKKAIIIRSADKIPSTIQKNLAEAFTAPSETTAVFAEATKWDNRGSLPKLFKSKGKIYTFKAPYPNEIPAWILKRAQSKYKRKMDHAAAGILADLVGNELGELDNELQKLDTFVTENQTLTPEDVLQLVGNYRSLDIFELQNSLGKKERAAYFRAVKSMLDQDQAMLKITLTLSRHFMHMWKIRNLLDQRTDEKTIAAQLGLNWFFHFKKQGYREQAQSRSARLWKKLISRLAKLEMELKQGKYSYRFEQELALASLIEIV